MAERFDRAAVVDLLNQILESELAGGVRHTHYSFMIYGHARIPIIKWIRGVAEESLRHAEEVGEMITHLGEHPSLGIGPLLGTHNHDINTILRESLESEERALALYKALLAAVKDRSVLLEEYARRMLAEEELHAGEVNKMLRAPGEIAVYDH